MEKDNILNQKTEALELVERLERKKDQLLRENEKLKAEKKGSGKYLFGNNTNMASATSLA